MNTHGEYVFTVRGYECGQFGKAKLSSIMNYLQESASRQAEECGFSKSNFDAAGENVSWVVTHLHLRLSRLPNWEESVNILTWPCGGRKIVAERDFLIRVGGETIGRATSEWMLIDLSTRKIVQVPQSLYAIANDEFERALGDDHRFARLRWDCREIASDAITLRALQGDIDLNGHVNNSRYVEWLAESLPKGDATVADFEIAFKSETLAGDEIRTEAVETEPGVYVARVASPTGSDHVIARFAFAS